MQVTPAISKIHVIIGASAAGIAAALKIRQLDAYARIICITAEQELPYNKCLITDYLAGIKTQEQLLIFSPDYAREKNITLLLGHRVKLLEIAKKQVILSDDQSISFDTLFIATGTRPIIPSIPGNDAQGIFTFHGMQQAQGLLAVVQHRPGFQVVVVGAGLSGLECADALHQRGVRVCLVERANQLLPRQSTIAGSSFLQKHLDLAGVETYLGESIVEIHVQHQQVTGVTLARGRRLQADYLVFASGARPNSEFAADAGIITHEQRIVVDETMQTNMPGIYAGGDIVIIRNQLTGNVMPSCTWPDAMQQGMVAAHNMVGVVKTYPGCVPSLNSAFFGLKIAAGGSLDHHSPDYKLIENFSDHSYQSFILHDNVLKGFLLIGPQVSMSVYKRMLLTKQQVSREQLLQGTLEGF